jgi:DNA-binding NarL/FixJ family response regulator
VDGAVLANALSAMIDGLAVLDPGLASHLLDAARGNVLPAVAELTPRETEVLGLMAEGLPNKAIAARLSVSEHTVKFHVNSILGKMGARSRTEAVAIATRAGLATL